MKNENKTFYWLIACVVIGIVILLLAFFMCKDYLTSEIKLKTKAEVVDVKKTMINKESETNYKYNITWQFTDEHRGITKKYETIDESHLDNVYNIGQKKTIYVYSNDGENYKHITIELPIGMIIVGLVFIIFSIIDMISINAKNKKEDNIREVINQRIAENGSNNIKNS